MFNDKLPETSKRTTDQLIKKSNELKSYIDNIVAIDHHCHNVLGDQCLESMPLIASFGEGAVDNNIKFKNQSKSTLIYRRSIKELAEFYKVECKSNNSEVDDDEDDDIPFDEIEKSVELKRRQLGLDVITRQSFEQSKLESIILDDSLTIHYDKTVINGMPSSWHSQFLTKVYKVLRLETILEQSLVESYQDQDGKWSFQKWKQYITEKVTIGDRQPDKDGVEIVGFKSILAYRCGLGVEAQPDQVIESEYERILRDDQEQLQTGHYRVASKLLIDFFLRLTMSVQSKRSPHPLPVQIHTGYGDSDLDLEKSNPLLLKKLIVEFPSVPIVLLHCSYPYAREGAFLCWIYPNVYIDTGLAIPILSQRGMIDTLASLLEICPIDKIIYSSDSHHIPELYYLASKWSRYCLHQVLLESIEKKEITLKEAKEFVLKIFRDNVINLYNLKK